MIQLYSAPRQQYNEGKVQLSLHSEHPSRSAARSKMNDLRHINGSHLYVIYDGKTFVSSTL